MEEHSKFKETIDFSRCVGNWIREEEREKGEREEEAEMSQCKGEATEELSGRLKFYHFALLLLYSDQESHNWKSAPFIHIIW